MDHSVFLELGMIGLQQAFPLDQKARMLQMRFPAVLVCQPFCSWLWWLITQDVVVGGVRLVGGGHPAPPKAQLSFFIQKQHRASEGADCTPDSIDCFPTLLCLFLFIWLLYFRALQSLFWPERNVLFYFWLPCSHVNASIKKRTRGGRGSGVPVCCPAVCPELQSTPLPRAG